MHKEMTQQAENHPCIPSISEPSAALPSISIYGSCASRDVFSLTQDKHFELKAYIARQSIISAVAPRIPEGALSLHNPSSFRQRAVECDLQKTAFEMLRQSKSDYLLIDLIDERFPLLPLFGSYVTASNEFYEIVPAQYRSTNSVDKHIENGKLYLGPVCTESAIQAFCERLQEIYRCDQVILHQAMFVDRYWSDTNRSYATLSTQERESNGTVKGIYQGIRAKANGFILKFGRKKRFAKHYLASNHRLNAILETMYSRIQFYLPGVHVIRELDGIAADENHKWGLAPMHYEQDYYRRVLSRLYEIAGLPKREG